MKRTMKKLSHAGHDTVATWDTDTVKPERLKEIEEEFNKLMASGYIPADITDHKDEIIRRFDPDANILFIPRMAGGID